MGFFKSLFGGQQDSPEEQKQEKDARDFDVLKFDGVKAMRINQMEHAVRCFETALTMKEDLEVRDYLSQALIQNNQLSEALGQLDILSRSEPDNTDILLRMANVCFLQEDYDHMSDVCRQILQHDDSMPLALMMMARAQNGLGNIDEAVAALTKAVTDDEDFGDARLLRADILLKAKRFDEAKADAEWLLERAGEHEDVLMLMARLEHEMGNDDDALQYYNKVMDVNPFLADAYRERANIRLTLGDTEGYEEDMKQARDIVPDNAEQDIEQKMQEMYRNSNPFG